MQHQQSRHYRAALRNFNKLPDRDRFMIEERFLHSLEFLLEGSQAVYEACLEFEEHRPDSYADSEGRARWYSAVRMARQTALRGVPDSAKAYFQLSSMPPHPERREEEFRPAETPFLQATKEF